MRFRIASRALPGLLTAICALVMATPLVAQGKKQSNPAANPTPRDARDRPAQDRHKQILARAQKGDVDLVFLGDSITQGWGGFGSKIPPPGEALWKARYEPLKGANFGVGADSTQHALWRITRGGELKGLRPKLVVLMIGINNVNNGNSAEQIAEGHAAIIKAIQANHAGTKVLLVSTFPAGKLTGSKLKRKFRPVVKALNTLLARQADGDKVRFLDIHDRFLDARGELTNAISSDEIHLTGKGYQIWADAIQPTIDTVVGKSSGKPTAPTGQRTRWVHADGELVALGKGAWEERQKSGKFTFVEKASTAEYVELYDQTRDYTLRLTASAMLIKGGKGALPKFADFTRLREGKWAGASSPTPVGGPHRLQWKYATGYVQNEYSGQWSEKNNVGTFKFVEKGRTAAHVELYDQTRDYTLRLTANAMLIKGGKGALPKFADFTRLQDGKWVADFPVFELGKLSEREESGGRGPGTVSSGVGDPGGVSYGTYQLSSKLGRADEFVRKYYPREFAGLKGGTAAFSNRWRELARKDPAGLHRNEHAYIKETHHDVQARKLAAELKLDVSSRSRALQDVVWSIAVQHGPSAAVVVNALKPLVKSKPAAQLTDEEMIRAIYTERSRKNDKGKLVYAPRLDDRWTAALVSRFARERKEALAALDAK